MVGGSRNVDTLASSEIFLFENFRLDRRGGGLFQRDDNGAFVPVAVGSRGLDILGVLIASAGVVVSKDEIISAVWPGTVVEDSNLTVQISALRRVLDHGRSNGSCIQTVAGRGYRFVASATCVEEHQRSGLAAPRVGERTPPRLSIVVLPFRNLSDDPEQQYFADGITEDLTTDLSRIPDMFVISRNTAFTYRNKPIDTKEIGRDLRVRYVLEGSVRRMGDKVRVTAQLIDAETDAHLWAERFAGDMNDLFALQDEITSRIAIALKLELPAAEAARQTEHPDALDYILRARVAGLKPPTRENRAERIDMLERALALDPRSVEAQCYLANGLTARVLDNMTDTAEADTLRAEELAERALAVAPRSALVHYAKGQVLRAQKRYEEAISEYDAAIALDRNFAHAYGNIGQCLLYNGSIEEAIPLVEQAIRLSPHDPQISILYQRIGLAHLVRSRIDEAVVWLEKARNAAPAHPNNRAWLASAYALKGESERAAAELAESRRLSGDDRFSSIARLKALGPFVVPKFLALSEATIFAGLRKAGVPEE
jgi:TolB-like protein/Flp pilus assembly protein TadD